MAEIPDNFDLLGLDDFGITFSSCSQQQLEEEHDSSGPTCNLDEFDLMFGDKEFVQSEEKSGANDLLLFDPFAPVADQTPVRDPLSSSAGKTTDSNPFAPMAGQTPDGNPFAPMQGQTPDSDPFALVVGQTPDSNPFAPVVGQAPDNDPFDPVAGQTPDGYPFAPAAGQTPDTDPFAPMVGQTPNRNPFAPMAGQMPDSDPFTPVVGQTPDSDPFAQMVAQTPDTEPFAPVVGQAPDSDSFSPVTGQMSDNDPFAPVVDQIPKNDQFVPMMDNTSESTPTCLTPGTEQVIPTLETTQKADHGSIDISCSTTVTQPTHQTDNMERTNLNKSMEKSFEDLLHGLDSDSEPDLDEMITNHSTLPENITDDSFNAMAAQNKEQLSAEKKREQQLLEDFMTNEKPDDFDLLNSSNQKNDNITSDDFFSSEVNEKQNVDLDDFFGSEPSEKQNVDIDDFFSPDSNEKSDVDIDDFFSPEQNEKQTTENENLFEDNFEMIENENKYNVQDEHSKEMEEFLNNIPDEMDNKSDRKDEEDIPVVMVTQDDDGIDGLKKEESFDFSVLQDGNQLDVDIEKHKTSLRKKGSLARRKKPTRNSVRRSILNSDDDSHFTDSTGISEPGTNSRPTSMNGYDGDIFNTDMEAPESRTTEQTDADLLQSVPTSPPAKKPSLGIGTPLPGMAVGKPPVASRRYHDTTDQTLETDRNSKKDVTSIGVKLPMPVLRATPQKSSETSENMSVFDKPALKSVGKTPDKLDDMSHDSHVTSSTFDKPILRSVPTTKTERQLVTADNADNLFETPKLKRVTRQRAESQKSEESSDNDSAKTFQKPTLKNVSSKDRQDSKEGESGKTFVKPALRSVKQDDHRTVQTNQSTSSTQHTFDKPTLRSTPMKQNSFSSTEQSTNSEEKKSTFSIPVLRKTPKPQRKEYADPDSINQGGGIFEKPALKTTSTPSFSRTDSQESAEKSGQSAETSNPPSWLKDMKLRRSKSPERTDKVDKESSKPSWASTAAEKRSKARDLMETKENYKTNTDKRATWSDNSHLQKTPNGLPLQEDNRRRRTSSTESDRSEDEVKMRSHVKVQSKERDQYVPSWLKVKENRHKSTPNLTMSPPENGSDEVPQWKRELAERRKSRKDTDSSPMQQRHDSEAPETPSWKLELQKRRKSTPTTPAPSEKKPTSKEPEWKTKAEEKRKRLKESGLLDRKPAITEKPKIASD